MALSNLNPLKTSQKKFKGEKPETSPDFDVKKFASPGMKLEKADKKEAQIQKTLNKAEIHNITREQAVSYLETREVGEFIFRKGEKPGYIEASYRKC